MPIPGARFRVVNRGGSRVRLAFKDGEVVEAKNIDTGATHTQTEFKKDRQRQAKHRAQVRAVRSFGGDNG